MMTAHAQQSSWPSWPAHMYKSFPVLLVPLLVDSEGECCLAPCVCVCVCVV